MTSIRSFLSKAALGTLGALLFFASPSNAQIRQTQLFIDDGSGAFSILKAGSGGGTYTFPGSNGLATVIVNTFATGQSIEGGLNISDADATAVNIGTGTGKANAIGIGNTASTTTVLGTVNIDANPATAGSITIGNSGSTTNLDGTVIYANPPQIGLAQNDIFIGNSSALSTAAALTQDLSLTYDGAGHAVALVNSSTATTFDVVNAETVGGALGVTGNTSITGTLGVTGDATLGGSGTGLAVTNNATVGGTLGVTGNTSITGTLGVTGDATLGGSGTGLAVTNAATVGGTLGVTGAATIATGSGLTNSFGTGATAANTIGNVGGTTTVAGFTTLTGSNAASNTATLLINQGSNAADKLVLSVGNNTASASYFQVANSASGAQVSIGSQNTKGSLGIHNGNGTAAIVTQVTSSETTATDNIAFPDASGTVILSAAHAASGTPQSIAGGLNISTTDADAVNIGTDIAPNQANAIGIGNGTGNSGTYSTTTIAGLVNFTGTVSLPSNITLPLPTSEIFIGNGTGDAAPALMGGDATIAWSTGSPNNATVTVVSAHAAFAVGTNETVGGTLGVTGNTTLAGTLGVTGATTLTTLDVTGASTTTGITNTGAIANTGDITETGNQTISGTLGVTGNTTLTTVTSSGDATLGTTSAATANSFGTAGGNTTAVTNIIGNTNASTSNQINGATTVTGALTETGSATVSGTLGVTGLVTTAGGITNTGAFTEAGGTTNIATTDASAVNIATAASGAGGNAIDIGSSTGPTVTTVLGTINLDYSPASAGAINIGNTGSTTTIVGALVLPSSITLPLPSADIFVGNGSGHAAPVAMSGDATIDNTGKVTVASAAGSFAVTDNETVGGTLGVTGTSSLTGNVGIGQAAGADALDVKGTTSLSSTSGVALTIASSGGDDIDGDDWNVTKTGAATFDNGLTVGVHTPSPIMGTVAFYDGTAGGLEGTLEPNTLTSPETWSLPDETGTVVLVNGSGVNSDIKSLTGLTTALPVGEGGTGLTTLTEDGVIYAATATTMSTTGAGTSGQVLTSQGGGGLPPQWTDQSGITVTLAGDVKGPSNANTINNTIQAGNDIVAALDLATSNIVANINVTADAASFTTLNATGDATVGDGSSATVNSFGIGDGTVAVSNTIGAATTGSTTVINGGLSTTINGATVAINGATNVDGNTAVTGTFSTTGGTSIAMTTGSTTIGNTAASSTVTVNSNSSVTLNGAIVTGFVADPAGGVIPNNVSSVLLTTGPVSLTPPVGAANGQILVIDNESGSTTSGFAIIPSGATWRFLQTGIADIAGHSKNGWVLEN